MRLVSLLEGWQDGQSRRAKGGLYALAGFDFQARVAIAEFFESLTDRSAAPFEAGQRFTEAFSDLLRQEDSGFVCVQVKRTLTRAALLSAAQEVEAISAFLAEEAPDLAKTVRFEVVAQQGAPLAWADLADVLEASPLLATLHREERLLPPRFEPDPWWRAISAVWHEVEKPFELARFALEQIFSQGIAPSDAVRVRDRIAEELEQRRRTGKRIGRIYQAADFESAPSTTSTSLEVGKLVTPERQQRGQYWTRSALVSTLLAVRAPRHPSAAGSPISSVSRGRLCRGVSWNSSTTPTPRRSRR